MIINILLQGKTIFRLKDGPYVPALDGVTCLPPPSKKELNNNHKN